MSTELDDDCAALVADPKSGALSIYLPPDVEDATGMFAFICACAAKASEDPQWAEDLINWFLQSHNIPTHPPRKCN